jgi:hypothetical protein
VGVAVKVTVRVIVRVGVEVEVIVTVGEIVNVTVIVGVGRSLVKTTVSLISLSGTALDPIRVVLPGIIILVCALSLYTETVPNPKASVVPVTDAVLRPDTPDKDDEINIAAPETLTLIA